VADQRVDRLAGAGAAGIVIDRDAAHGGIGDGVGVESAGLGQALVHHVHDLHVEAVAAELVVFLQRFARHHAGDGVAVAEVGRGAVVGGSRSGAGPGPIAGIVRHIPQIGRAGEITVGTNVIDERLLDVV
jgi:hypothetical protein